MTKKLLVLVFTILAFLTINAYATDYANIPVCSVTLSGQEVDNSYRQYPLLQFRDIVYFPMTYHDCRFLGVSTNWNGATNTLTITKENISGAYRDYNWEWKNTQNNKIDICKFNIVVNGKVIDNSKEAYPLITFRDVTYFPLTWRFAVDELGWEYSYDDKNGLVINSSNKKEEKRDNFRVIGYYSYDLFEEPLEKLQTDKLTHIMYAFLIPQADGSVLPLTEEENVRQLIGKAHSDNCEVFIAVGGWSYNNIPLQSAFEQAAGNSETRKKLVESIVAVVENYGFDGVELDWEYPTKDSAKNYEALIVELDSELEARGKQLTAALNGAWSKTEGPEVSKYVSDACLEAFDFINVMSYDMNNDQHSPFWFANTSIDYWINRGVDAEKIVLGMPLYARPTFMQYRHLAEINKSFVYNDYAVIDGVTSYYNGLPTLCKKTILAAYKAGGVMLFDVNEDTNDETSIVSMIDYVIEQIEKEGFENVGALKFISHTSSGIDDLLDIIEPSLTN